MSLRKEGKNEKLKLMKLRHYAGLLLVLAPGLGTGWAAGFRLSSQDAFASGRGEAFAATADNPSAIYYNPAGLTQIEGLQARVGSYNIYLAPGFEANGRRFENQSKWHVVPQVFAAYGPENLPLTFGLGVYSPYGLGLKWAQDTGFRSIALESKMKYLTAHPVVALEVLPGMSLAAGPTFNYSRVDLKQGVLPVDAGDVFRFKGDDEDVGYTAGWRWQPHAKLALGAAYRSRTTMAYEGYTDLIPVYSRMDARLRFPIPHNVVMGISYRPTEKWNFEFNADFTEWSRVNQVSLDQAFPLPPFVLNWQSSWYYEVGVTRYLDKGWSLSAGYIFNESCMPDAFFNPLVADTDKHFITFGASWRGQRATLDFAYQFGYGPPHTVRGSAVSAAGQSADGRYDFTSHAVLLSFQWRF